jgi:recombination associated protein RdgC
MYRNVTFFLIPQLTVAAIRALLIPADSSAASFEDLLRECELKPVGPSEMYRSGFVPPLGSGSSTMAEHLEGSIMLTVGSEARLLPPAIVDAELRRRVVEFEKAEGRNIGGRERKRMREDLVLELLPRALVKTTRLDGYVDLARGLVAVNTASRRAAEGFVRELRTALGSFPALPVHPRRMPRSVMTSWLQGAGIVITEDVKLGDGMLRRIAAQFALGDECELRDPGEDGAIIRFSQAELGGDEVREALRAGMGCARLGLVFSRWMPGGLADTLGFTLGEDLAVRKLRFLDVVMEQHAATDHGSLEAELQARFILTTAELGALFDRLLVQFDIAPVEG